MSLKNISVFALFLFLFSLPINLLSEPEYYDEQEYDEYEEQYDEYGTEDEGFDAQAEEERRLAEEELRRRQNAQKRTVAGEQNRAVEAAKEDSFYQKQNQRQQDTYEERAVVEQYVAPTTPTIAEGEEVVEFEDVESEEAVAVDLENEEAYMDIQEALKSERFVHRAVLSAVISKSSGVDFNKFYLNHLIGFTAVLQRGTSAGSPFTKFNKAAQGLSFGYVFNKGHAFEAGIEFSGVSSVFGGYRFFWESAGLSFWPMFGVGAGMEISGLRISDVPLEARLYSGKSSMGFVSFGLLVPLVDVGIKVEFRGQFYGTDRIVLSQGVGAIIFL